MLKSKYYVECDRCHAVLDFHDKDIYKYDNYTYINCPYCDKLIVLTVEGYPARKYEWS